jgi:uncharacterized protein (TIGR02444 family)
MSQPLPPTDEIARAIWDFTLALYDTDGVQAACLDLQNRHGLGVSALLALMGLGAMGWTASTPTALEDALRRSESWQHEVIEAIRAARQAIKVQGADHALPDAPALRQQVMRCEVDAERLQQWLLIDDWARHATPVAVPASGAEAAERASDNAFTYLARYARALSASDQTAINALVTPLREGRVAPPRP